MSIVVSESEAMQTLPALLEGVSKQSVIIATGKPDRAVIVSMKDYEFICRARSERLLAAMDALQREVQKNAARQGVSLEELQQMLDCDAS